MTRFAPTVLVLIVALVAMPTYRPAQAQEWAQAAVTVRKSCGKCGGAVSSTAKVGDRCPHCGAIWGRETTTRTTRERRPAVATTQGDWVPTEIRRKAERYAKASKAKMRPPRARLAPTTDFRVFAGNNCDYRVFVRFMDPWSHKWLTCIDPITHETSEGITVPPGYSVPTLLRFGRSVKSLRSLILTAQDLERPNAMKGKREVYASSPWPSDGPSVACFQFQDVLSTGTPLIMTRSEYNAQPGLSPDMRLP